MKEFLNDGPNVYELYSILMHRGGAFSGHYYAYIKSFENGLWYIFNDTKVREVCREDIKENAFGSHGSSNNAYSLIYRRIPSTGIVYYKMGNELIP